MAYELTPAQLKAIEERTRRECEEQGLPFTIEDPVVLAKVARLLTPIRKSGPGACGSGSGVSGGAGPAKSRSAS